MYALSYCHNTLGDLGTKDRLSLIILSSTRACVKAGYNSPIAINVTIINIWNINQPKSINQLSLDQEAATRTEDNPLIKKMLGQDKKFDKKQPNFSDLNVDVEVFTFFETEL